MSMVKGVVGGAVGGALGAAVWAGVAYFTNFEIGWIAWGIGALVGAGTAMGAGNGVGPATGAAAAGIAVLSVLAGKYAAVDLTVRAHIPGVRAELSNMVVTDDMLKVDLADEVVGEFESAGKTLNWPAGMTVAEASREVDYPPDVWAEMLRRWDAIPVAERERTKSEMQSAMRQAAERMITEGRSSITRDGFLASFGLFDLLWFGLAVATAFRLGAAGSGGAES